MNRFMTRNNTFALLALVVALLAGAAYMLWPKGEDAARTVATDFVQQLQHVPLTADEEAISAAIEQYYAPYVTPELLAAWLEAPESAPGRDVSSPWPDRIFIKEVTPQGEGYIINADVLYVTSVEAESPAEDAAGVMVVMMQLIPTDDGWRIAAYEELFGEGLDGETENIPTEEIG